MNVFPLFLIGVRIYHGNHFSKSNILLSVLSDVKLPVRESQLTSIVILKNNRGKGERYGR
ncbi:MAG: hypothetical protein JRC69_05435 [Deltaproteobacteria bacterium]|nr:hypothetical protein [Deltaproteobacteria bacterium]